MANNTYLLLYFSVFFIAVYYGEVVGLHSLIPVEFLIKSLEPRSLQFSEERGMNLLNVIRNALVSPDVKKVNEKWSQDLLVFDFIGIFKIVYRVSFVSSLNTSLVIISLVEMFLGDRDTGVSLKTRVFLIGKALLTVLGTFVATCLGVAFITKVLYLYGATIFSYSMSYLMVVLYGCSSLAIVILIHWLLASRIKNHKEKWLQEDVYFDAAGLVWVFSLLSLYLTEMNSSFMCCTLVFSPTLVRSILGHFFNLTNSKGTQESLLFTHVFMQVIPLSLLFYCVWSMYTVFIPIMGRIGAMVNPDLLVGEFTSILVFLSTCYMMKNSGTFEKKIDGSLPDISARYTELLLFLDDPFYKDIIHLEDLAEEYLVLDGLVREKIFDLDTASDCSVDISESDESLGHTMKNSRTFEKNFDGPFPDISERYTELPLFLDDAFYKDIINLEDLADKNLVLDGLVREKIFDLDTASDCSVDISESDESLGHTALHKIDFSNIKTEQIPEDMGIDQARVTLEGEHRYLSDTASKEVSSLLVDPEYQAIMKNLGKDKVSAKEDVEEKSENDDEEEANKLIEKRVPRQF